MAELQHGIALSDLHEETSRAHALFRDGHHQEAVRRAAQRYSNRVAERTGEAADTRQGMALIVRAFSENDPLLAFNSRESLVERDEHNGYRSLAVGLVLAIRNVLTHTDDHSLTESEAFEWLAFISAMHRRLDSAQQVVQGTESEAGGSAPEP